MVRLHEFQGKHLLQEAGIAIPNGNLASDSNAAGTIAEQIGRPVAVKAQIWPPDGSRRGA